MIRRVYRELRKLEKYSRLLLKVRFAKCDLECLSMRLHLVEDFLDLDYNGHWHVYNRRMPVSEVARYSRFDWMSETTFRNTAFPWFDLSAFQDKGVDVKYPWEVSRFYFAPTHAYYEKHNLTKEPLVEIIRSWNRANPFAKGINWTCTMDVSIRLINWLVSLTILYPEERLDADLMEAVYAHVDFIIAFDEVSRDGHSTNHGLVNYCALTIAGISLRESSRFRGLYDQGVKGLQNCLDYQLSDQGVHNESSLAYHGLVLEAVNIVALIARSSSVALPVDLLNQVALMNQFMLDYSDDYGAYPNLGDNDGGRICVLGSNRNNLSQDFNRAMASILFDFSEGAERQDTSLIVDLPNKYAYDLMPLRKGCIAYEEEGFYIFRMDRYQLFLSLAGIGMNGQGGHDHIDSGTVLVTSAGAHVIYDYGIENYTRSYSTRQRARGPEVHNLPVMSGDLDFQYFSGLWSTISYPTARILHLGETSIVFKVRSCGGGVVQRTVSLASDEIVIEDSVSERAGVRWFFGQTTGFEEDCDKDVVASFTQEFTVRMEDVWPSYDTRSSTNAVDYSIETRGKVSIKFR